MITPHPAHAGQRIPLPAHQPGRPTPARLRQVMIGSTPMGRAFVAIDEKQSDGFNSRKYNRISPASIKRLEQLLKAMRATPVFFLFHLDGPTVFFDVYGAANGGAR